MANTIDPNVYLSNQPKDRAPSSDLGKDEFLKILMTQLQNQDPLDPLNDKDFIAQMATFSSLEQQMRISNMVESIAKSQMVSPVIQYSHMISKQVSYIDDQEKVQTGEVVSVTHKNGMPVLELDNNEKIYADIVEKVGEPGELDNTDGEEPEEEAIIGEPDGGTDA